MAVLYYHTMRLSADPKWVDRDRFIMSKGHCAVGIYPVLAEKGYFLRPGLITMHALGRPWAIILI
jgi:transketolase